MAAWSWGLSHHVQLVQFQRCWPEASFFVFSNLWNTGNTSTWHLAGWLGIAWVNMVKFLAHSGCFSFVLFGFCGAGRSPVPGMYQGSKALYHQMPLWPIVLALSFKEKMTQRHVPHSKSLEVLFVFCLFNALSYFQVGISLLLILLQSAYSFTGRSNIAR